MTAAKKSVIATVCLVGLILASFGALYLSAATFLITNKRNPLTVSGPTAFVEYWEAYSDDAAFRKKLILSAVIGFGVFFLIVPGSLATLASKTRALHGEARFARHGEIKKSHLLGKKGIIVGKWRNKYLMFGGQWFVLLAAPTRSGKGVGIVIPNLLNWPDSVMALDMKGTNFDATAGYRAHHRQEIWRFAPFDEQGRTHRYNPLAAVRDHRHFRVGDIQTIAVSFYPTPKDGDETATFFTNKARDLFLGIALYLMETPSLPFTIGELLRQSSGKGKPIKEHLQKIIEGRARENQPLSEECTDALGRFMSNASEGQTLSSIQGTFNAPLGLFADPLVDAATSTSDFSLADVRKRRMSIYFNVPAPKLEVAGVLINLLFSQLIDLNTRELPKKHPELKYQCLLLMDEFTAYGRMPIVAKSAAYIAEYNLRLLTVVQSIAQLAGLYGENDARTFYTNHALQIMYAPKEQKDANEYSETLGTFTQKAESRGRSHSMGGRSSTSSSTNVSDQRRPLMLPQELREMGEWREIVVLENCKPIFCKKICYFEDKMFMTRYMPPPVIKAHDIDAHIARVQNRKRPATVDEITGGIDLSVLAHDMATLPHMPPAASQEQVAAFVDEFFEQLSEDVANAAAAAGGTRRMRGEHEAPENAIAEIDLAELER